MNRALIRRLLNEYLDGEIGLADKAELERVMAADPAVRAEYKQLRQVGLLLGSQPEVEVHPWKFRERVAEAVAAPPHPLLTPQRAFASAMLIALLVIGMSFSLLMYQQQMLGRPVQVLPAPAEASLSIAGPQDFAVSMQAGVPAQRFFSRLLVEDQLGMLDPSAVPAVIAQTSVLEGARCTDDPLAPVELASDVRFVRLSVAPRVAVQLSKVAEDLSGESVELGAYDSAGNRVSLEDYLREQPREQVTLQIKFD